MKLLLANAALVLLSCGSAIAGVQFELLEMPGQSTSATEISGDGTTIVGGIFSNGEVFRWKRDTGFVELTAGGGSGGAPSCNYDGTRVTGTIDDAMGFDNAGLWVDGVGWTPLGALPMGSPIGNDISSGWGISGDGLTCVGLGWGTPGPGTAEAFQWTAGTGMVNMGTGFGDSRISRTNYDGTVHAGWTAHPTVGVWRATIWVNGVMDIVEPDAYVRGFSSCYNVNEDGTIVVGEHIDAGTKTQPGACYWTWDGMDWVRTDIGVLSGEINPISGFSTAQDVSSDGSVIVGIDRPGGQGNSDGWFWTPEQGMTNIETYLAANGATVPANFNIQALTGVSADGRIMCGWGTTTAFPIATHSFVITLCPADLNNDSVVDTADLGILINAFGSTNALADINGDGIVDTADLGILISEFNTQCQR